MIFLTGATGFLGSHVLDELISRGVCVWALVRRPDAIARLREKGVERVQCDLLSLRTMRAALKRHRAVISGTGYLSDWGSWQAFREAPFGKLMILAWAPLYRPALRNRQRDSFRSVLSTYTGIPTVIA